MAFETALAMLFGNHLRAPRGIAKDLFYQCVHTDEWGTRTWWANWTGFIV